MPSTRSSFVDKVLGRIGRLDAQGLQTVVERLARERNFLEMLFNIIEDGVLVVDENGRILYFNEAVTRILNWQPEAVEGQLITRFLPEMDWEALSELDAEGGRRIARHEFEISYPRQRFIRLYAAPLDGQTVGSSGVALVLHDATEARQKTFEAIENERIHSLTLLAASVAHEIGNPLNALHIHLQLMGREIRKLRQSVGVLSEPEDSGGPAAREIVEDIGEGAEKLDKYLGVAKGEIVRLDYIITQFLQAIRPTRPQLKPATVNDVVRESLDLLRPELENRGIAVEEKLARHVPATLIDAAQIKQALVNLIKNAMQAMSRGGRLTIETGEGADGVWMSVADTGGGIPQERINRIFEPFFTTKEKGTGLGLMIVQRIVREHSGRIELESREGQGTTFRVWLPIHQRPRRLLKSGAPAVRDEPAPPAEGAAGSEKERS